MASSRGSAASFVLASGFWVTSEICIEPCVLPLRLIEAMRQALIHSSSATVEGVTAVDSGSHHVGVRSRSPVQMWVVPTRSVNVNVSLCEHAHWTRYFMIASAAAREVGVPTPVAPLLGSFGSHPFVLPQP